MYTIYYISALYCNQITHLYLLSHII